jgi:hypothetical protein
VRPPVGVLELVAAEAPSPQRGADVGRDRTVRREVVEQRLRVLEVVGADGGARIGVAVRIAAVAAVEQVE